MGLWVVQWVARLVLVRDDQLRNSDLTRDLDDRSRFAMTSLWGKIVAIGIGALLCIGLALWATVWLTLQLL